MDGQPPLLFVAMDGHELAMDASGTFYAVYLLRVLPAGGGAGGEAVLRRRYRQFQDLDGKLQALPAAHRPQRKDLPVMTSKRWGLGLRDEQDIFLLLGTACIFVADVCFAVHLRSQKLGGSGGLFADLVDGANATQATFFACSAAAALYAFAHQVALVRARGCAHAPRG